MKYKVTLEGYRICKQTIEVEAEDHVSAIDFAYENIDEGAWTMCDDVIDAEVLEISPDEPEEDEEEEGEEEENL